MLIFCLVQALSYTVYIVKRNINPLSTLMLNIKYSYQVIFVTCNVLYSSSIAPLCRNGRDNGNGWRIVIAWSSRFWLSRCGAELTDWDRWRWHWGGSVVANLNREGSRAISRWIPVSKVIHIYTRVWPGETTTSRIVNSSVTRRRAADDDLKTIILNVPNSSVE